MSEGVFGQLLPKILIGTGGYSDEDLLGTLYPHRTSKQDFLHHYANHYDTLELNATFHTFLSIKAVQGLIDKANGRLKFTIKVHQQFSHHQTANQALATDFLKRLEPLIHQELLIGLLLQFPPTFHRTPSNRLYLKTLCDWLSPHKLILEFRCPSWHCPPVFEQIIKTPHLHWCHSDYPVNIGLPTTPFWVSHRTGYVRLHGKNPNWHKATTAKERHDYRYSSDELYQLAKLLFDERQHYDTLYLYFQNTTNSHSFYNIMTLKEQLKQFSFITKTPQIQNEQCELF